MRFARIAAFAAAALTMTLTAPREVSAQDLGIERGSMAPGAKVATLDGKDADLSAYIGKMPVLMEFWATWCSNCKELEPTLLSVSKKYAGRVRFIGVAVSVNETPDRVKA